LSLIQPLAKQAVGLIQSWMMFELASMIRIGMILEKNPQADTTTTDKFIKCGRLSTIIFTAVVFASFSVFCVYISFNFEQELFTFYSSYIGYTFLAIAVLMFIVNAFLILQI
jgi:hypothetical protein